jgi:hypothetical protein
MAISGAVLRIEWSAWLIFLRKRRVILSCTLASECPSSDGEYHPEKRVCVFVCLFVCLFGRLAEHTRAHTLNTAWPPLSSVLSSESCTGLQDERREGRQKEKKRQECGKGRLQHTLDI